MIKKKFNKNHEIFLKFLLPYLIIMLIPLIIVCLAYIKTLEMVESDTRESNLAILEQGKDVLDRHFEEMDSLITQIAWNPKVRGLLYMNDISGDSIYKVRDTWNELSPYLVTNKFINNFQIYFKRSDVIIMPETSCIRPEMFYGGIFKYGDMSYSEYKDNILNQYHNKDFLPSVLVKEKDKQNNMIVCVQSIPFELPNHFEGNIVLFIKEQEIHKLLRQLRIEEGGFAYIENKNGDIITSIGNGKKNIDNKAIHPDKIKGSDAQFISGQKMLISHTRSSYNGWVYVAAIPYRVVMAKVDYIKKLIVRITFISMLIGVLISILLASKNSKPIKDTISILDLSEDTMKYNKKNYYYFLQSSIKNLINSNNDFKKAVENQAPLIKAVCIDRLLKGEYKNTHEMEAILNKEELGFKGSTFIVIILKIDGYNGTLTKEIMEELDIKKIITKDTIDKMDYQGILHHDIDIDKIALIISIENNDTESYKNIAENLMVNLYNNLSKNYNIKMSIGGGNAYANLLDMSFSYYEANSVLENNIIGNDSKIIWYDEIPIEGNEYYYPLDIELRLINLVKSGSNDEVQVLMDSIWMENFNGRELTPDMIWQFMYEIKGTIIKVISQVQINDSNINETKINIDKLFRHGEVSRIFKEMIKVLSQVCDIVNSRKKSHNNKLLDETIEYINNSFSDANLCLNQIADYFNVSTVYLSHFFKEQTGENFSVYLEMIRIKKAQELLAITDLSVTEVSEKCGYNSSHSFRRAYKRTTGTLPSAIRNMNKSN